MATKGRRLLEETLGKEEKPAKTSSSDFWAGKTVCWQMVNCPPAIRNDCPAIKFTSLPCWEIEGTYCKLQKNSDIVTGTDTSICEICRVYKKYGEGKRIELKLRGKGIDKSINTQQSKKN